MADYFRWTGAIEFSTQFDNIYGLLSKDSEINLYRVVQECTNNVVKHSGDHRVAFDQANG